MHTQLFKLRRSLTIGLTALLFTAINLTPIAAFADGSDCTPPDPSQPGVHKPVGADAGTYSYNCDTSMWENAHYTYNPATGVTSPKDAVIYTYNSSTGMYDTTTWVYSAPNGSYVARTQSVSQPPAGARVVGGPAPISSTGGTGSGSNSSNGSLGSNGGGISNTGSDSNNTVNGNNSNSTAVNNTTGAGVNNISVGQASTGNTLVIGNTSAGSATSGNAQDIANVVNILQSSSNVLGGNATTFVANIDGDVNGDFLIDPSLLGTLQPASDRGSNVTNSKTTINNDTNASINNDIKLAANSGNADVSKNTSAGNATSGQAQAIANVVNVINSAISGGKSFLGVININGNLNGDILMPPDFVNQLIASNVPTVSINTSNTGPDSTNTTNSNSSNETNIKNTNNGGITNNIKSSAASGQASVNGNTAAGGATSGSAKTNVTAFNLTGSNVVGANDMLVFVNVLGSWVGMIVNAPAGSTAAELGGGITGNTTNTGPNSTNSTNNSISNSTNIDNKTNQTINNTIDASAKSGNANISSNTKAGDAKSGDAKVAVNLLNVENSSFSLSDWFGVLFINVFGNWNGSFGVNTAAGDPIASSDSNSGSGSASNNAATVFRFVPTNGGSSSQGGSGASYGLAPVTNSSSGNSGVGGSSSGINNSVLAAHTDKSGGNNGLSASSTASKGSTGNFLGLSTLGVLGSFIAIYAAFELFLSRRATRKAAQLAGVAALAARKIEVYRPQANSTLDPQTGKRMIQS